MEDPLKPKKPLSRQYFPLPTETEFPEELLTIPKEMWRSDFLYGDEILVWAYLQRWPWRGLSQIAADFCTNEANIQRIRESISVQFHERKKELQTPVATKPKAPKKHYTRRKK